MLKRFGLAVTVALAMTGSVAADAPKKVLLVGQGPDGHPATTHEYMAGLKVLSKCLSGVPGLEVATVQADEPWKEGPELMERADLVVLFLAEGAKWSQLDPKRFEALRRLAARGGGIIALHWAMGSREEKHIDGFVQLVGGCHGGADRKYKVVEVEARPAELRHAINQGIEPFTVKDEFYYQLKFAKLSPAPAAVLQVPIDGKTETVAWAWERPDGGRSFGFSGLHFHDNWKLPAYRRLVAQGVLWTLKLPIPKEGLPVQVNEEDLKLERK